MSRPSPPAHAPLTGIPPPPRHVDQGASSQRPFENRSQPSGPPPPINQFQTFGISSSSLPSDGQYVASRNGSGSSAQWSSSSGVSSLLGVPTIYEAWSFKKVPQPPDGSFPSWALAVRTPIQPNHDGLVKMVKNRKAKGSVQKHFQNLFSDHQREQIEALLKEKRYKERDPNAKWELASLKDVRGQHGRRKGQTETKELQVVLKRHSVFMSTDTDKKAASLTSERLKRLNKSTKSTPPGEVVDLRYRQHMFPRQQGDPHPRATPDDNAQCHQAKGPAQQQASGTTTAPFAAPTEPRPRQDKVPQPAQGGFPPAPPQVQVNTYQNPYSPPKGQHAVPVPPPPAHHPPPKQSYIPNFPPLQQPPPPLPKTAPPTKFTAPAQAAPPKSYRPPPMIVDDEDSFSSSRDSYEAAEWDDSDASDWYDSPFSTPPSSAFVPRYGDLSEHPPMRGKSFRPSPGGDPSQRRFSGTQHSDEIREITPRRNGSHCVPQYPYEVRPPFSGKTKGLANQPESSSYMQKQAGVDDYVAATSGAMRARRRNERREPDEFAGGFEDGENEESGQYGMGRQRRGAVRGGRGGRGQMGRGSY
ncbi:MAG: hypothetical protein M1828_000899 [Chrysothrix sp. TS-e1954]|nr:MAG: hypothetical protein M1828_000899 [Chrysothrix sp. TS-e1954]